MKEPLVKYLNFQNSILKRSVCNKQNLEILKRKLLTFEEIIEAENYLQLLFLIFSENAMEALKTKCSKPHAIEFCLNLV